MYVIESLNSERLLERFMKKNWKKQIGVIKKKMTNYMLSRKVIIFA